MAITTEAEYSFSVNRAKTTNKVPEMMVDECEPSYTCYRYMQLGKARSKK